MFNNDVELTKRKFTSSQNLISENEGNTEEENNGYVVLNEISTDQLGNRGVARREALLHLFLQQSPNS
jgi:hypothetical protein